MRITRTVRLVVIGIVLILAATPAVAGHPKTDIVTIDDGSTFVGEILKVRFATLSLKTDAVATLSIEWRRVTGMTSEYEYQVELTGGERHYGSLQSSERPLHIKIVGSSETIEVRLSDILELAPIEHGSFQRLNGSINFGLTYTQANQALQYNVGLDANYRSRKNFAALTASSIFNTQKDGESTQQSNFQILMAQVSQGAWGPFEVGSLQSNPDQGYDVRTLLGGGITKFFVENSAQLVGLSIGAVYNREDVTGSDETDDSAEFLAGVSYRRYKRDAYSPSIQTSLNLFTDIGSERRYRAVFNFNIGWKIIQNFTFNFQINNSYDSDPPGTDSSKNNFVVVTSIGYTF